ncbi:MAG: molecular chaperone DnaJ [Actinomycetota bacterium]
MRTQRDYYEALGVSAEASADEIKAAFRALAREHHPDATGGDAESEQRYKEISEAYAVLSDPAKRQQYDNARMGIGSWSSPWGSPFASTIEDIFETFFGGGGGGGARTRQRSRSQPGQSIEMLVDLTLEEVVFGAKRTLSFERLEACEHCHGQGAEPGTEPQRCERCQGMGQVQETRRTVLGSLVTAYPCRACQATGWVVSDPCKECRGDGRVPDEVSLDVEIPAGLDDGDRMRLDAEGEAGTAGGRRGDLYLRFRVIGDERFERLGDDLQTWAEIPMTIAALGGEVVIPTLDGNHTLEVHAGTQSIEVFRLKGLGVARRNGRGRGELLVRAHVVTPTKISKKEKELLRELAKARGEDTKEARPSVIRRVLGLS